MGLYLFTSISYRYDLAADAIRREIGLNQQNEAYQATGRLVVALVLVQLAREDVVAAEKAFKEWGEFLMEKRTVKASTERSSKKPFFVYVFH